MQKTKQGRSSWWRATVLRGATALTVATIFADATPAAAAITVQSDPVLFWNERAVSLMTLGPPSQTRAIAMMNIAVHDAVSSVLGGQDRAYLTGVTSFGGDVRAAASQAAYQVLSTVDPTHAAAYAAARDQSFALVTDPSGLSRGIQTGSAFANAVITQRTGDGSTAVMTYIPNGQPGNWVPTSPAPPAFPQWSGVQPFELTTLDAFAPPPPPKVGTAEYAAIVQEVRDIGSATSVTRSADQTASALFWDAANGLTWVNVGLIVGEDEGLSTIEFARAFATLGVSLADAAIVGFDAKYENAFWRPITAIANDPTNPDSSWRPLFTTPNHPSYPSAHAFFSGAGETVLTEFFGDDEEFTMTIAGDTRHFAGIHAAAEDGASSRLWGGIHFSTDNQAGLALGRQVAGYVLAQPTFDAAVPEPATWASMTAGFGLTGAALRRRRRRDTARRASPPNMAVR